jgi:CheY-like chemotaxis protein
MNESTPHTNAQSKTILVVEDEPLVRDCIVGPLQRLGHRILSAGDGVEGAVLFARNYEGIDLLVTDISMPGMQGTDLARFARKIRADIKIIFASGSVQLSEPHPSKSIEAAVFLNKPFTMEELLRTVSGMLGQPYVNPFHPTTPEIGAARSKP